MKTLPSCSVYFTKAEITFNSVKDNDNVIIYLKVDVDKIVIV